MQGETKMSKRVWFNIALFGFMGQVAWNIENMYFNTFLYNSVYAGVKSQAVIDSALPVTRAISIMVALSAATAVLTTFVMGNLSDKLRRRKVFISVGYILWGLVTAAFGLITRDHIAALLGLSDELKILTATVWTVIIMDCVMTFMGSTSNDSAFNAWITDVTTPKTRPVVEGVLAVFPLLAMGVVMVFGSFAQSGKIGYDLFFICLGLFVTACGVLGLFTMTDPQTPAAQTASSYWSDLFYGFRPSTVKQNIRLYLTLCCVCVFNCAVQVFFPYFLIYLQYVILPASKGVEFLSASFLVPCVLALGAAAAAMAVLFKSTKNGKSKALIVSSVLFIIGLFALGFAGDLKKMVIAASPMLVGYAVMMVMLNAVVRDFTPKGKVGLFQGIRMIFGVLIPMIIGPFVGNYACENSTMTYVDEFMVEKPVPTPSLFLYAAAVSVVIIIPLALLVKKGADVSEDNG